MICLLHCTMNFFVHTYTFIFSSSCNFFLIMNFFNILRLDLKEHGNYLWQISVSNFYIVCQKLFHGWSFWHKELFFFIFEWWWIEIKPLISVIFINVWNYWNRDDIMLVSVLLVLFCLNVWSVALAINN